MKLFRCTPVLFATVASAFVVPTTKFGVGRTCLYNQRIDSSEAVQAALEASKKYGPASPEARVAWDVVEEMDASDNRNAYSGGEIQAPEDYQKSVAALSKLLEQNRPKIDKVKELVADLRDVKLAKPAPAKTKEESEAYKVALADAKKATEEFGEHSDEAKLAWETVEEVAAAESHQGAPQGTLYDECLVEALDACEALDELSRVLYLEKNQGGGYSG